MEVYCKLKPKHIRKIETEYPVKRVTVNYSKRKWNMLLKKARENRDNWVFLGARNENFR